MFRERWPVVNAGFGAVLNSKPLFGQRSIDVAGQNVTDADVALGSGRSIKIQADPTDPLCRDAASATIHLEPSDNWGALLFRTVEAAIGQETQLDGLAPGRYRVTVTKAAEGCFGTGPMTLEPGANSLRVPISPGGIAQGRLEGVGEPLVTLFDLDDARQPSRMALPDPEHPEFNSRDFARDNIGCGRELLASSTLRSDRHR